MYNSVFSAAFRMHSSSIALENVKTAQDFKRLLTIAILMLIAFMIMMTRTITIGIKYEIVIVACEYKGVNCQL